MCDDEEQDARFLLIWDTEWYNMDNRLSSETEFDDYIYGLDEALARYKALKVKEAERGASVSDIQLFQVQEVLIDDKTKAEITQEIESHKKEVQSKKEKEAKERAIAQEARERKQFEELQKKYGK